MRRRNFLAASILLTSYGGALALESLKKSRVTIFGDLPEQNKIQRIFAAGAPAGVLTYVLAPEKLLGWPQKLSADAKTYLCPAFGNLPFLGNLNGRGGTVPLESLLALNPDLILDAGNVDAAYMSFARRRHLQTGIPYVLIDGNLQDIPQQLREVGVLLGVSGRAEHLASEAKDILTKDVASPMKGVQGNKARIYLARGHDGLETALAGSINAEVIDAAGGLNVASSGRGRLARVSMEQILNWNPDVIITQDENFFARAQVDSPWSSLPAVKARRLYLAPSLPFGWLDGPAGINRLIGVRWLSALLSKNTLDQEFSKQVDRFYQLFYGYNPGQAMLNRLLGNS